MDKNQKAFEQLQKGIIDYVENTVEKIPYDKTFNGIIIGVLGGNKYNIKLNGVEYSGISSMGGECKLNEVVKVKIPQNNYNNMYIEKFSGEGGGGGATITVDKKISPTSHNPVENRIIFNDLVFKGTKEEYKKKENEVFDGQLVIIKDDEGGGGGSSIEIYDGLDQTKKGYALDATQGRILKEMIDSKEIEIDDKLSNTSTNPIQNKIITKRLDEVFQSVSNGKQKIADAITDKGVESSANETFDELAKDISNIQTGRLAKTHLNYRKSNKISFGLRTEYHYTL